MNNTTFIDDLDALEALDPQDDKLRVQDDVSCRIAVRRMIDLLTDRGEPTEEFSVLFRTVARHAPEKHLVRRVDLIGSFLESPWSIIHISKAYYDFCIKHASTFNALARIGKHDILHELNET